MSLKKTCKQVPEMSDHLKMPRHPIFKAPLKAVSFTLRKDQAAYLGRMPNASEFIRDLIDQHMLSEERPISLVAMLAKLGALRKERNDILTSPEYTFDEEDFDVSMLEEEETINLVVKDGKVYHEFYDGEEGGRVRDRKADDYQYLLLPLNEGQLKRFGDEHGIMDYGDDEYVVRRSKPAFLELVKAGLGPDKLAVERLEARLAEIEAEIEKVEEGVSSVTQGAAKR